MVLSLHTLNLKLKDMIHDWLLIGIKDGKCTVLVQTGEAMIHYAATEIKKKLGESAFDKYIMVQGAILNV